MRRLVLFADPNPAARQKLVDTLTGAGFEVSLARTAEEAHRAFYADPPHCMILPLSMTSGDGANLLKELKRDNVYGHLPAIITVSPEDVGSGIDWISVPADDFVVDPINSEALLARIHLCWSRAMRDVNANPLTGLPGNLVIGHEAERRLGAAEPFAFAYLDLDGFKSFNDRYGFARGDEIIRMTARILVNTVRAIDEHRTHVGHVGGDDFVFVTPAGLMNEACEQIIASFDAIVPDFYDDDDRKRGGIDSIDRQGNPKWYPLVTCSIGAVDTTVSHVKHIAELFGRVSEVKNAAKHLQGSRFVVDRRE
ncbi:MAG: diguanylate cyclase [Candidatus Hydrogenedentes bacterium]|nr:diguanylate cyclase [Candidatus Hydrogenedentota bacterium]